MAPYKTRRIFLASALAIAVGCPVAAMNGRNAREVAAIIAVHVMLWLGILVLWLLIRPQPYPEKIPWVLRWFPRRTFIRIREITMFQRLSAEKLSEQVEAWRQEMYAKAPRGKY